MNLVAIWHVKMASRGRGRRGRPRGTGQAPAASDQPPAFDQQAFAEAVGIENAAITQACAIVSQGGSNDLQRLEAHRPPMVRGGVDSRVRTTMTIEEWMLCEASRIWVLVLRGRKIHLLPTRERSRRLLFRKDIQDRAEAIRTKAKMGHLVRQGR